MDKVIYVHRRKDNGIPFYIGRGSITRANKMVARSKAWSEVYAEAGGATVEIIEQNLTLAESKQKEIEYIASYRRQYGSSLVNYCIGGDAGPSVGVRVFYNSDQHIYFPIAGMTVLADLGFTFNKVQSVCKGTIKTTNSDIIKFNGDDIRFMVKYFPDGEFSSLVEELELEYVDPFSLLAPEKDCIISRFEDKNYFIYVHEDDWSNFSVQLVEYDDTLTESAEFEYMVDRRCVSNNFGILSFQLPMEAYLASFVGNIKTCSRCAVYCDVVGVTTDSVKCKIVLRYA